MMRFPLRLTAELTMARLAQKLRLAQGARPIQFVDAAEILHPDSSHPVSHEKIRDIIGSRSPVIWIGEANRCVIQALRIWFAPSRRAVILFSSKPLELFSAAAFMSFSRCRGSF